MKTRLTGIVALTCLSFALCAGQDLKGAKHVVERMIEAPKEASEDQSEFDRLIDEYVASAGSISASKAGEAWVDLLIESFSISRSIDPYAMYGSELPVSRVMNALPPPESWPAIQAAVGRIDSAELEAEAITLMTFLSALLNSDLDAQNTAISGLVEEASKLDDETDYERMYANSELFQLYANWSVAHRYKDHVKRSLELMYQGENLSYVGFSPAILLLDPADRDEIIELYFENGDRVRPPYMGSEELMKLYRDAALKYGVAAEELGWQVLAEFGTREQFEEYCRKVGAFKSVINDRKLTEAIVNLEEDGTGKAVALAYYFTNLAIDGYGDDAVKILLSMDLDNSEFGTRYVSLADLRNIRDLERIAAAWARVLEQNPKAPLWSMFTTAATRSANGERLIEVSEGALASGTLSKGLERTVQQALISGLLAADRVDEAIELMLTLMAEQEPGKSRSADSNTGTLVAMTMRLGLALDRDDLIDAAMSRISELDEYDAYYLGSLSVDGLVRTNRLARAESLLLAQLENQLSDPAYGSYGMEGVSGSLLKVYAAAGRYDDVLYMLANAPMWPWSDLSESLGGVSSSLASDVALTAAEALHAVGRSEEALKIVKDVLVVSSGTDAAYELFVDIAGTEAIPYLDRLFDLDQFEERPVIWKAQVMLNTGDYAAAERLARQAASIDPSDGEQGKDDRMRVYGVLSEALKNLGDEVQAKVYAGAVQAIRMSEQADDLYAAGLTNRAIALYQRSLTIFEDAYCIQSRLAVQLLESGRPEEAAKHFRKAFELMPDSFGRVESHCFGCEGIFNTTQAQDIALTALRALQKDRPEKPQISYLLGFVLETRGEIEQAVDHYERAVELDPAYLNAWGRLSTAYDSLSAPQEKRETAAVAVVRLDPFFKHGAGSSYGHEILDFKELWKIGAEAYSRRIERSDSLFDLPAARKRLSAQGEEDMMWSFMMDEYDNTPAGPVTFVLRSVMITQLVSMLERLSAARR